MSVQTSYNFNTAHGVAGGLYDISPYTIDARTNEAANDKLRFGFGVVDGTVPGKQVNLPTADSKKENFEGIVVNSHAHEQNFYGEVKIRSNETVGVLKDGRAYVRIAPDSDPQYGDAVYLVTDGEYAGYFTTEAGVSEGGYTAIKLNGHYISEQATDAIAPVYIKVDKLPDDTAGDSTLSEEEGEDDGEPNIGG